MEKPRVTLKIPTQRYKKTYQRVKLKFEKKMHLQNLANRRRHIVNIYLNYGKTRKLQNTYDTQQTKAGKIEHQSEQCKTKMSSHSNLKPHTQTHYGNFYLIKSFC